MGDWQEMANALFITFIFAFMLAKLFSFIVSFRQNNLRIERERSVSPSAPSTRQAAATELEKHNSSSDVEESDLSDLSAVEDSEDSLSGPEEKVDFAEAVARLEHLVVEGNVESESLSVVDDEGKSSESGDAAKEVESMDATAKEEAKVVEFRHGKGVEAEVELSHPQEVETMDVEFNITADEKHEKEVAKDTGTLFYDSDDWEGVETTELEENFGAAASYIARMASDSTLRVSNDLQLQFYALYKQATEGSCTTAAPPAYKLSARAKWQAWQKLGGGMSSEEAMQQYIALLSKLRPDWNQGKGNKNGGDQPEETTGSGATKGALGPVFSMLIEPEGTDESANLEDTHRCAREGDVEGIRRWVEAGFSIEQKDSDGRTALHWAVDRGHFEIVKLLVSKGALIDSKDLEGQTALHYATVCEREEIAKYLLGKGADPYAHDNDGVTPCMSCPAGWIWMPGSS